MRRPVWPFPSLLVSLPPLPPFVFATLSRCVVVSLDLVAEPFFEFSPEKNYDRQVDLRRPLGHQSPNTVTKHAPRFGFARRPSLREVFVYQTRTQTRCRVGVGLNQVFRKTKRKQTVPSTLRFRKFPGTILEAPLAQSQHLRLQPEI